MTKADIAERIQKGTGFTKKEAIDLLDEALSIIKDALEQGENLKISGFGNFNVKQKHDRRGRNPQNGETITIEARTVVTFKASKQLRDKLNRCVEG